MIAVSRLRVVDDPSTDDLAALDERIYAFNVAATGIDDGRLLAIFEKDAAGNLIAGLSGHTWGGTCEVKLLWVAEAERGKGRGKAMLAAAEAEARTRGCAQIVLATHAFQAPGFYAKLGYQEVGRIPDYPRGHANIWLTKKL